jgi:predicted TIM-barrel fold metal-dependent hydrolase
VDTKKHNTTCSEFLADTGEIEVLKVVHIDAAHDPADPLAETRWLQSLADDPNKRGHPARHRRLRRPLGA